MTMGWLEEQNKMTDTGLTVGDLFNATAPTGKTGQQLWEEQNAVNNPPAAPSLSSGPSAPRIWQNNRGESSYENNPSQIDWGQTTPIDTMKQYGWDPSFADLTTRNKLYQHNNRIADPNWQWDAGNADSAARAAGQSAPSIGGTGAKVGGVNPITGEYQEMTEEMWARVEAKYNELTASKKAQQDLLNNQAQQGLDTARMAAEWKRNYDEAMVKLGNQQLAAQVADNMTRNSIAQQQQIIAAYGQQQQANYQGQQIALGQADRRVATRQRTPMRSARIREVG